MKNISVVQPMPIVKCYILPPISFFSVFESVQNVSLDAAENYQKRSLRNKYTVLSANGPMSLSIPLRKGKNKQQNIRDVQIAYEENWVKRHLEALRSCYGKSAYFEHYFPLLEQTFFKKHTYLFDMNMAMLQQLMKWLKLETNLFESHLYNPDYTLPIQKTRAYPQVFEEKYGFVTDLSIVDLIFNMGPESRGYLHQ